MKKLVQAFGLLAAGITGGALIVHLAAKPSYEEAVYNQLVEAFETAAAAQALEAQQRAQALKEHHAKQRQRALEILPILKMEMAGLSMQTADFERQLTVNPYVCSRAKDSNVTYTELDRQLAAIDDEIEAKQREGVVLRTPAERSEHKALLKNQQQAIEKRCAMFF